MDNEKRSPSEGQHLALSAKSAAIMQMIAGGHTYEQILKAYPDFTYTDIFAAAQEALDVPANAWRLRRQQVIARYPRAYERWTAAEEEQLDGLVRSGHTVAQIATVLQRQRSAIRSRILRLDLVNLLTAKEKARFERIVSRYQRHVLPETERDGCP